MIRAEKPSKIAENGREGLAHTKQEPSVQQRGKKGGAGG